MAQFQIEEERQLCCLTSGRNSSFCITYVVKDKNGKLYWDRKNEFHVSYDDKEIENQTGGNFFSYFT
jgi:hypothetical protein